jgi:CheY-like chemotaxis protein
MVARPGILVQRHEMTERRVVAVVPDLFFATRIAGSAARLGVALEQPGPGDALEVIRRHPPDLVLLDLHATGEPLALARALRADPATRSVPIVGFYAHVDQALRTAALAAGVDQALPRSAFTARLPALLTGEAGTPAGAGIARLPLVHDPRPTPQGSPMEKKDMASSPPDVAARVRISCPGCGRNDYVSWPANRDVFHWKCFNCGKEFDLTREGGH